MMHGLDLPDNIDWSANELIELLAAGLTPAEAVDYWATEGRDYTETDWADVRGTTRQNVNQNANAAKRKL